MSGALSQPIHQVLECDQHLKVARFRNHLGLCDSPFGNEVARELLSLFGNDLDKAVGDIDRHRSVMKADCPNCADIQIVIDYYHYKSFGSDRSRSIESCGINVAGSDRIPQSIYFMTYNYFLRIFND
jgi:hypothetical protein